MKQALDEAVREYIENHVSRNENASFSAAFRAGAKWQANQSPWISVEDAVPNENANGICQVKYVDGSIVEIAMRKVKYWIYPYIEHGYVTHWRPIPSFDEILEANKDVLKRIKEKGD